jgi:hypothetical protein
LLLAGVVVAMLGFIGVAGSQLVRVLPAYQDKAEALKSWMIARGLEPEKVLSLDQVSLGKVLGPPPRPSLLKDNPEFHAIQEHVRGLPAPPKPTMPPH